MAPRGDLSAYTLLGSSGPIYFQTSFIEANNTNANMFEILHLMGHEFGHKVAISSSTLSLQPGSTTIQIPFLGQVSLADRKIISDNDSLTNVGFTSNSTAGGGKQLLDNFGASIAMYYAYTYFRTPILYPSPTDTCNSS